MKKIAANTIRILSLIVFGISLLVSAFLFTQVAFNRSSSIATIAPSLNTDDITLYVRIADVRMWERTKLILEETWNIPALPLRTELPAAGAYELAVIPLSASGSYGWTLAAQLSDNTQQQFANSESLELFRAMQQNASSLADTAFWKEFVATHDAQPNALWMHAKNIPVSAELDTIVQEALSSYEDISVQWNANRIGALSLWNTENGTQGYMLSADAIPYAENSNLFIAHTNAASLIEESLALLRRALPERIDGIQGIATYVWKEFAGNASLSGSVLPLLEDGSSIEVLTASGGNTVTILSGHKDNDALNELRDAWIATLPFIEERTIELPRGVVRRDLRSTEENYAEETMKEGTANIDILRALQNDRELAIAQDKNLIRIANNADILLDSLDTVSDEHRLFFDQHSDVFMRAVASIPWIKKEWTAHFPFLLPADGGIPWQLLTTTDEVRVAVQKDPHALRIYWHFLPITHNNDLETE